MKQACNAKTSYNAVLYAAQDCIISDGQNDICSDEQLQQLQPGQRLLVRPKQSKEMAVFKVLVGQQ